MIPTITASKIYSTLGNSNSLIPLAIKDCANSIGLTAASYTTGDEVEGRDRFIDEFGTQAIWLLGIPAYKKVLDLTLFKSMDYDPKVDVRVLKDQEILKKAKQYAPTEEIRECLTKVGKNQKTFKGLSFAKFVASTLLTILSYWGLTKFRHKHTEDHIKELYLKEHAYDQTKGGQKPNGASELKNAPSAFAAVHKSSKKSSKPSFTGVQDFMFSPTKNLMIVDGAISAERIFESRTPQDQIGYIIKEGGFWAFMYFAGQKIQKHFENVAEKKHKISIDLDARVIESDELKNAIKNNTLIESLEKFPPTGKDSDIYDFVCNPQNKDNIVVKMAKKSDIVTVMDKKDLNSRVDTRAYIDIEEVKGVRAKLAKLHKQYETHTAEMMKKTANLTSEQALDKFLDRVRTLKRSSIWKNMGSCVVALGVIVPAIMVALRFADKNNKGFQVKEEVEKKLKMELQG